MRARVKQMRASNVNPVGITDAQLRSGGLFQMRLVIALVLVFILAMAQVLASPRASASGDLTLTRTASGLKTSTHVYRGKIDQDFAAFWRRGLPCATIRNLFVLKPRLDTYLYNPVEGGPLGPGGGGTGAKRYVWAKSKLPISDSNVSCKMMSGSLSGKNMGTNKVEFTYTTRSNSIDGKYTLKQFQIGSSGTKLGYDPVVRTYFDAALHVTLSAPAAGANGPVTSATSVTVSNISTMALLAKDAPTIQGLVAHLGVAEYDPPGAHWPLVYSVAFPWPNPPSCCFLHGGPFPGWTKWLDSHMGSLLSDASKGFSDVSLMNNFLAESKSMGANTTNLTYSSSAGVVLLSSALPAKTLHNTHTPNH